MPVPHVSIVIPMLNEVEHIGPCLESFRRQTYPLEQLEVLVVDGGSTDGSREAVQSLVGGRLAIRMIENPARRASAAFNRGVEAALGEVICLFSAHGIADERYVEASVASLEETGAAGVGGRYLHVGQDAISNAIGLAMVSPFGMASPHRFATRTHEVDTISHPAYNARALREVDPFDESLLRNSDYELNWRLRQGGASLIFDPTIISVYRPRPSIAALSRQFWWYGRWKERVIWLHPGSLRARHLIPPLFVLGLIVSPLILAFGSRGWIVALVLAVYGASVLIATVHARPFRHRANPGMLVICFPVMHVAWGAGFLLSTVQRAVGAVRR